MPATTITTTTTTTTTCTCMCGGHFRLCETHEIRAIFTTEAAACDMCVRQSINFVCAAAAAAATGTTETTTAL